FPGAAKRGGDDRGLSSAGGLGLHLDVVLNSDLFDQLQLRLEEIDVLLLALEDLAEQVAGHEVAHPFAKGDRLAQLGHRLLLASPCMVGLPGWDRMQMPASVRCQHLSVIRCVTLSEMGSV